jgi:hypothetical protein
VQDNDEQLRGVPDDGAQGSHARCGRSCSAAAAGRSAREQRDRARRMSEAVEEEAAEGATLMRQITALAKAEVANMTRQARYEKLCTCMRRSRRKQRDAGLTRRARPATVVGRP